MGMKRYLRFDSVGGASGDMILAALTALGADLAVIEKTIQAFFPEALHFHAEPATEAGLNGMRVSVHANQTHEKNVWPDAQEHAHSHTHGHTHGHMHGHTSDSHTTHTHDASGAHTHRGLCEIEALLSHAPLSARTHTLARQVFRVLAEAEATIHGKTPETVHFHEVGAWDSVADIVGACLALEQLEISGLSCGPLPAGCGTIQCAHGEMPNPAPATQRLLSGMVVTQTDEPFELVTPTAAALLRVWTQTLETVPTETRVLQSAFGFGTRMLNHRPNVLRATVLESVASVGNAESEPVVVMETNLDDCNPEWLGALTADLLTRGALDVWQTPVVMKKGRAGIVLSVLAPQACAALLRERIFRATTTFGIRTYAVQREVLARRYEQVQTPWGEVPVKVGLLHNEPITWAPEYEVCAARSVENNVTPRQVAEAAQRLAGRVETDTLSAPQG